MNVSEFPRYNVKLVLRPAERRLEATATVLVPPSSGRRNFLEFSLSELMEDVRAEIASPIDGDGVTLTSRLRPYSRPGWGTVTWRARLPRSHPSDDPIDLRVSYRCQGDRSGNIFSVAPEGAFGAGITTAWYPEIEEPTRLRDGRLRGLRGTGTLQFNVPAGYAVHAPGKSRMRALDSGKAVWFDIDRPVFFSFAAAQYAVLKRRLAPIQVAAYVLRPRNHIANFLEGCSSILDRLAREFGPYPHPTFAIAEVTDARGDAAGFAGASLEGFILATSSFLDKPFNIGYYGHEISHQWWGVRVRSEGNRGRWMLSEGMAQYGSYRAVEALGGAAAAEAYRRQGHPGYFECSADRYFRLAAAGFDCALSNPPAEGGVPRILVNSKGYFVMVMLAELVGRARFRTIMKGITRDHAFRRVAWAEFLDRVGRESGVNLTAFCRAWFDRPGAPEWNLRWKQDGTRLHGVLRSKGPSYPATRLEMLLVDDKGRSRIRRLEARGVRTVFSWRESSRVRELILDPRYLVLRWTPHYREEAEALVPHTKADMLLNEGRGDEACEAMRTALAAAGNGPDPHGLRFLLHLGLAQHSLDGSKIEDSRTHAQAALAERHPRPDLLPRVYLVLAKIAQQIGDGEALRRAVEETVRADRVAGGTGAAEEAQRLML